MYRSTRGVPLNYFLDAAGPRTKICSFTPKICSALPKTEKGPSHLLAGASWQSGSNVAVFRPFRSALRVEPNPSLKLLRSSLVQSAFFGQGAQGLVYLRQIFVRWSQARVNWQFRCPQGRRSRGIETRAWCAETLWECGRGRRLRATSPGQLPSTDDGGRRTARLSPAQVRRHAA